MQEHSKLLHLQSAALTETQKSKGQLHKVFEPSFDEADIQSKVFPAEV